MSTFSKYSEYYDLFYKDKDYEAECDFIEEVFKRYSSIPVKSILDIGCGTGGHAIPLTKRDHSVTGIDISTTMLEKAKQRAVAAGSTLIDTVVRLFAWPTFLAPFVTALASVLSTVRVE